MKKNKFAKSFQVTLILFLLLFVCTGYSARTVEAKTVKNGFVKKANGNTYYYKNGRKVKGWLTLKGKKYYFDEKSGVQLKGWQYNNNGKPIRYFMKGKGKMATGFVRDKKTGDTWYFHPETGKMYRGLKTIQGKTYYFNKKTGVMHRGWAQDSKGRRRYFSPSSGKMKTGWSKDSRENYWYFDKKTGYMYSGLEKVGKKYYYFNPYNQGIRYEEGFYTNPKSGRRYYFDPNDNGVMHTGWLTLNGRQYLFSSKGVMYADALKTLKKKTYGFASDGTMYQNQIGVVQGRLYGFNSNGEMYADTTASLGGKMYVFDKNGLATELSDSVNDGGYIVVGEEGGRVKVYDEKYKRNYYVAKEFLTHPGVSGGSVSDMELLAAICDAEAGNQGVIGMQAVAMCILNRTIKSDHEFSSNLRLVIYDQTVGSYPQYSPVRDGALLRRLNGSYSNRELAYQAAAAALEMFNSYVKFGTPRTLDGFEKKDFNYMYFMTHAAFASQPLNFKKVESVRYKDHTFFVDWVSA